MIVKLLTKHHLEFLSLKGCCTGSSESTLVKMLEISCRGSHDNTEAIPHIFELNFAMNLSRLWNDVRDVVTCMGANTQR